VSTVLQKYFRPRARCDPAARTESFRAPRRRERAGFRIATALHSKTPRLMRFFYRGVFALPDTR
jgi:hypothetical protein